MTKDRWAISLVLLNVFITVSSENEINPEIEGYNEENLQNGDQPEMVLPQDCFEVCNDYECLYLCPQPIRGVKRCITQLKSNKKSCCQNGQNSSYTGADSLKTAGKHIWQARDQLLGIRKEIENDLANRRYSLLKGLQPFSLKQYHKEPLFKLGTKTSKPKSNAMKLVCPVNDKKVTNAPNTFVNANNAVSGGGAGDNSETYVSQTLPYYENNLSMEKETEQLSDYNDKMPLSTAMMINENIGDIREQVSAPNSDSYLEGNEEMLNSVSSNAGALESVPTYDTDFPASINNNACNSPDAEQSSSKNFLSQPSPFTRSNSDQPNNYKGTIPNSGEDEIIGQNNFQSDPVMFHVDQHRGSPIESENSVLSQTHQNDFLLTTPSMHDDYGDSSHDVRKSTVNTAENIEYVVNTEYTTQNTMKEFQKQVLVTSEPIRNKQTETDQTILAEPVSKQYAYTEGTETFSTLPKNVGNMPNIKNIGESTSLKNYVEEESILRGNLEKEFAESSLRSEEDEHQLPPSQLSKYDVNSFISNETGIRDGINKLNTSESSVYVEREVEGSSKRNSTEHSYDYPNDDASSNVNGDNIPTSETTLSSGRDVFEVDDKKGLLGVLKQSASCNNLSQNYTCRILQELISKYNITDDVKVGTNAPNGLTSDGPPGYVTPKDPLIQNTVINSSLKDQNSDALKSDSNENESYFSIANKKYTQYSSKSTVSPTNIAVSKLDVENYTKGESIDEPGSTEINDKQVLSVSNNGSTADIHVSEPVESYSNILKSFGPNDELGGSNISYPRENSTPILETTPSTTVDSVSDRIIGDIVNETASSNRLVINPSHTVSSRAEQATTPPSVYLAQKGSFENSSHVNDSQFQSHPNQKDETIFPIKTNIAGEKPKNKNTNKTEFDVESNIEEPIFKNDFMTSNQTENHQNHSNIIDQELFYEAGDSNLLKTINTSHDLISVPGSTNEKLNEGTDVYDQNEKVLQLIPNVSEIPLPTILTEKIPDVKNDSIEDVYLRLEESNSSKSIENDNSYEDLYRSKHLDEKSTELNDSETFKDQKDESIINKRKLSDIINTELNSLKQPNVVLKKREEEEVTYDDDPGCDCSYSTSRDEDLERYSSPGQYFDRANPYPPPPVYPMFIVVPIPYHVCDCENRTSYNSPNNHIDDPTPYVSRDHSNTLPYYPFNPIYNNFQNERGGKAVPPPPPPYMPNFFFPFVPWGGMYNMFLPYHRAVDQYENNLQGRDAANENLNNLDFNEDITGEGLENSDQEDMVGFQEDDVSPSKSPETQRVSRNEHKETETNEYVFVDGQYVKVSKADKEERNGHEDRIEEPPTTVTEPSIDTSTTELYISTTQEPPVVTPVVMDTNENHRPVNYFYPSDFGGPQNGYYGYFPSYFFTHH